MPKAWPVMVTALEPHAAFSQSLDKTESDR
jgi:hypothetical protein